MPLNVPTACSYRANAGVCVCVLQMSGRDRKVMKSISMNVYKCPRVSQENVVLIFMYPCLNVELYYFAQIVSYSLLD